MFQINPVLQTPFFWVRVRQLAKAELKYLPDKLQQPKQFNTSDRDERKKCEHVSDGFFSPFRHGAHESTVAGVKKASKRRFRTSFNTARHFDAYVWESDMSENQWAG